MADIDVQHESEAPPSDVTPLDVILWVIGVLMIPLVPLFFILVFTPHSGM